MDCDEEADGAPFASNVNGSNDDVGANAANGSNDATAESSQTVVARAGGAGGGGEEMRPDAAIHLSINAYFCEETAVVEAGARQATAGSGGVGVRMPGVVGGGGGFKGIGNDRFLRADVINFVNRLTFETPPGRPATHDCRVSTSPRQSHRKLWELEPLKRTWVLPWPRTIEGLTSPSIYPP